VQILDFVVLFVNLKWAYSIFVVIERRCQQLKLYIASSDGMIVNYELQRTWKETAVAQFEATAGIFLDGLRKSKTNSGQCSRCPGQDFKRLPPEYKAEALSLYPAFCVKRFYLL
jgi:hypothetical protein